MDKYFDYINSNIANLRDLIDYAEAKHSDNTAFSYMIKKRTEQVNVSFRQFREDIWGFGTYLFTKGYTHRRIAIMGANSYAWIVSFFSVFNGSNIVVPVDKDLTIGAVKELMEDSESSVFVYAEDYEDIALELAKDRSMELIPMSYMEEYIMQGKECIKSGDRSFVEYADVKDFDAIFYTSGTTGKSKGVCLTSEGIARNAYESINNVELGASTVLLLPLHHTFGLVAGILTGLLRGASNFINTSLRYIMEDLQQAQPEYLMLVPFYVETFYKNIGKKIAGAGKQQEMKDLMDRIHNTEGLTCDKKREIFADILNAFGGKLTLIVSGGAPLNEMYIDAYGTWGIEILNGYGITECSPIVAVNSNRFKKAGSVGYALKGCKVLIDNKDENGNGEICVEGVSVMKGYYHMEKETQKVLHAGRFCTGDIGYIDKDGFLFITGRKKNLIILSNGENVSPEELENKINVIPLVEEALVYEKEGQIAAEVYLSQDYIQQNEIQNPQKEVEEEIYKVNKGLAVTKRIQKIVVRDTEFEKTTTKKIKR